MPGTNTAAHPFDGWLERYMRAQYCAYVAVIPTAFAAVLTATRMAASFVVTSEIDMAPSLMLYGVSLAMMTAFCLLFTSGGPDQVAFRITKDHNLDWAVDQTARYWRAARRWNFLLWPVSLVRALLSFLKTRDLGWALCRR